MANDEVFTREKFLKVLKFYGYKPLGVKKSGTFIKVSNGNHTVNVTTRKFIDPLEAKLIFKKCGIDR